MARKPSSASILCWIAALLAVLPDAAAFRPRPSALPAADRGVSRWRPSPWLQQAPRSLARLAPLAAERDGGGGGDRRSSGGGEESEAIVDYSRPKALKATTASGPRSSSSSSSSSSQQQQQHPASELEVVLATLRLLFCKTLVDPLVRPAHIENYALLIGDISTLVTFRTLEDMVLTPFPTLDIAASPDMIAKGLITYADPAHAMAHIYSVISDGMSLGFFWLLAVMWGGAEAVSIDSTRSYTLTSLNTFRAWLTLSNVRLLMLLLHALSIGEGVDLPHAQTELSVLLITMMAWRWLNVAVVKRFLP